MSTQSAPSTVSDMSTASGMSTVTDMSTVSGKSSVSTSSSPSPRAATPLVGALQGALGAEHAAVYGYGLAGARLSGTARAQARSALDAHRARRDSLARLIGDRGAVPEPSAPAYTPPFAVASAADATRLAVHLEEGIAVHLGAVVAEAPGDLRGEVAGWLRETAVWAVRWRGASTAFPGLAPRTATPPRAAAGAGA